MMFNNYKLDPVAVADAASQTVKALALSKPGVSPGRFAADAIAARLRRKPEGYVQYGPYWWAVKGALREMGHDFGSADDATVRAEYAGAFAGHSALVAGEQFRDYYHATFLAGTSAFALDDESGQTYGLFDQDMEVRRLGGRNPLVVAADLAGSVEEEGEQGAAAVLDDATVADVQPFAVQAAIGLDVWSVRVYAANADAAHVKVRGWEDDGALSGAVDAGSILDDASSRFHVDPACRVIVELAGR